MKKQDLIAFAKDAIKQFELDMDMAEKNYMKEDYAYAEGARNAYQVILNNLEGDD